jgi:hypothetical protein
LDSIAYTKNPNAVIQGFGIKMANWVSKYAEFYVDFKNINLP